MDILKTLSEIQSEYKALQEREDLTEFELPELYQALKEKLQKILEALSEEEGERFAQVLEAQLEKDFLEAEKETAKLFPEVLAEEETPVDEGEGFDQDRILESFIRESSGLSGYKKESNLNTIFANTSRLLRMIPPTEETTHPTDFIALFIDVGSTMVERRVAISKLILKYVNETGLSDSMKRLLNGVFAYGDQKNTKKAMVAMGEAIQADPTVKIK